MIKMTQPDLTTCKSISRCKPGSSAGHLARDETQIIGNSHFYAQATSPLPTLCKDIIVQTRNKPTQGWISAKRLTWRTLIVRGPVVCQPLLPYSVTGLVPMRASCHYYEARNDYTNNSETIPWCNRCVCAGGKLIPREFFCVIVVYRKYHMEAPKLHKRIPARKLCVTDVLCN